MKFSFILMLASLLQLSASIYSQTANITINTQNATISDIFKAIEQQTEYKIFYKNDQLDVALPADIKSEKISVKDALVQMFRNSDCSYTMFDKLIVIVPKTAQQGNVVTGTVSDASGTIPGVNVTVRGTIIGVVTDINGKYSITVPDKNAVLLFSFVGYTSKELVVGDRTVIDVVMEEDTRQIEEVVVIGYGTVAKRDLTGTVSSVSGNQLKDIPVTSAAQAIVGRMPGVQVTRTEGSPDADINIRVRGGGSITQDNSPLYIIDGFPADNINHISPSDIASIDVLKDASSTAIYGSRGANGVVIVTTKSGSEGKAKISYNMYYGVKQITKFLEMMNPYEYVFMQYEFQNGNTNLARYYGDPRDYDIWKGYKGTNWQKDILGNTGTSLNNQLSISGGTKTSKYLISMNRSDETEIMLGSGYDKTDLSVKTNYDAKDWLKIELSTRWSGTNIKGAGTGSSGKTGETLSRLPQILQYRPINGLSDFIDGDLANPDDFLISTQYSLNPLEMVLDDYRREARNLINVTGALEFTLFPGMKYRFQYGRTNEIRDYKRVYGRKTPDVTDTRKPMTEVRNEKIVWYQMQNTLTYSKRNFLPNHNLTVLAGEEMTSRKSDVVINVVRLLPEYIDHEGALSMTQLGVPDPVNTQNNAPDNMLSWFGRVNYDYKGKYLLSGVFRADASSKFAPGYQWGYFPSASAAWRISDEPFMGSMAATWLSNLKLRASLGEAGNNRIPPDAWKKIFNPSSANLVYMDGPLAASTAFIAPASILSNNKLKWETTITRNVGLDFGFFKQRISGTIDIYQNTTRDLLIMANVPSSTGYSTQWKNIGQTSNRGLELSLETIIVQRKDFYLSASFNISFNKNRVDKLGEVDRMEVESGAINTDGPGPDFLVEVGKPVGMMYGFVTDGWYTFDDFDYNDASQTFTLKAGVPDNNANIRSNKFKPGALKFVRQPHEADANVKNPVIDGTDKVVIGYAFPKHLGGFNINGQYKGIDFSLFFNWTYGNNVYNANKLEYTCYRSQRQYKNMMNIINSEDRFTYWDKATGKEVLDKNQLMEMNKNAKIWNPLQAKAMFHSWAVENGSFLRLNTATIGYSIPKEWLSRFHIEQLRVFVTGYNLWIWTNYSGYDPEVDTRGLLSPSVDWSAYPRSRTFNAGLNLTF